MKTFTQQEYADAISSLNSEEIEYSAIEVPLQEMFDEFMSFISITDFEWKIEFKAQKSPKYISGIFIMINIY